MATVKISKGYKQLVAEANNQVKTVTPAEAMRSVGDSGTIFVDLREIEELKRNGKVPGSVHTPRVMLEFYLDPESPYHKAELVSGKNVIFYCASGGRSALACRTAQEMGLTNAAHIEGGFKNWVENGGTVEKVE